MSGLIPGSNSPHHPSGCCAMGVADIDYPCAAWRNDSRSFIIPASLLPPEPRPSNLNPCRPVSRGMVVGFELLCFDTSSMTLVALICTLFAESMEPANISPCLQIRELMLSNCDKPQSPEIPAPQIDRPGPFHPDLLRNGSMYPRKACCLRLLHPPVILS